MSSGSLGVSGIVLARAELFTALKLSGAAYLLLVGATNPKSAFFLAFIPQFLDLSRGAAAVALQFLALGLISALLNTLFEAAVTLAASRIRESAMARPGLIRRLGEMSGGAMIALGIGLAFTKRPAN